ncbi:MAG: hypothetical protein Kow0069_02260 [Promethearchaeota archaeon]
MGGHTYNFKVAVDAVGNVGLMPSEPNATATVTTWIVVFRACVGVAVAAVAVVVQRKCKLAREGELPVPKPQEGNAAPGGAASSSEKES